MLQHLIVTHHSPDLDAVGAVWMLKRFDNQHYADAKVSFVGSGEQIDPLEAERLGFQLHQVTHVDTGLGEFDHHQPERGHQQICATSLTYDYVCKIHPDYAQDPALKYLSEFITDVDHFGEIYWPEASSSRYCFMLSELLRGFESVDPHNDESQLHFGMMCLDSAYAALKETLAAQKILEEGRQFSIKAGKAIGLETSNDQVIKTAQKSNYALVIRKDPKSGEVRIKARPDADLDLKNLAESIAKIDTIGTWYYHPSGKMLLNGSRKKRNQRPTPLSLEKVIELIQELYG